MTENDKDKKKALVCRTFQKSISDFFHDEKCISIDEIIIDERKRAQYSDEKVAQLARSISDIGLMNPITITEDMRLIAGYHRILAFKMLDRTEIPYRMTTITEPLKNELQEIDENLVRGNLIALEECEQIFRRKKIYEELYPETKAKIGTELVMKRWNTKDKMSSVEKAFSQEIAEKMGLSSRTIRRRIRVGRDIVEDLRDMLRDTKVAFKITELLKIAKLPVKEQKDLIPIIDAMKRTINPEAIVNLSQIKGKQILYEKESEKRRINPVEDLLIRKIIKYENKIKNFLFSGKDGKTPFQLWLEMCSSNDVRWEKGRCYTYTYCHLQNINFDVINREELNLSNFTLHHQPYRFKNMLTKQAFPINKDAHPKASIPELQGKEWDLLRGGFIENNVLNEPNSKV